MRVNDVSHITQRMVFLRVYEILVEANQSVLDRRDFQGQDLVIDLDWQNYNAGYPFCYFTGEVLDDLLQQPIVWREQHITLESALEQAQPDLDHWLTPDIRNLLVNDFFSWQPHTLRVQELVDDVKQRVLDVVDAIHSVEQMQSMELEPRVLHIQLGKDASRRAYTGAVAHSLSYRFNGDHFEPLLYDAAHLVSKKWFMHALIHGMWLVGQAGGHVSIDTVDGSDIPQAIQAPLVLI